MRVWTVAATGVFLAAFLTLAIGWLGECGAPVRPFFRPLYPPRKGLVPPQKDLVKVFLSAVIFRVVFALGALLLYDLLSGEGLGLSDLPGLWLRWDAPHYQKLVELGYDGYRENGQPLFLVFYPLYVWLTRGFTFFIHNTALAGLAVSALCFAGGSVYLYALVCREYGQSTARRTLLLLVCYPFSFFFGGMMTESLFLLTTAAGLWHIRSHHWVRFALWGALAALTRMVGLILIGAAIAELVRSVKPFSLPKKEQKAAFLSIFQRLPLLLCPLLGSGAYLALNYHVTGDPFAFTVMQQHWSQGFQWFPSVLAYLARHALTWETVMTRWEMWIPELLLFPFFALLLWRCRRKHSATFTLYAFVYLILNYCLSWLLSAGRYLSCALPFFFFAADGLEGKPRRTAALCAAMALAQGFFLYRYFRWGQVM